MLLLGSVPFFGQPVEDRVELLATPQKAGTSARLQAVSVVANDITWVSGLGGTYGRTLDSGDTWEFGVVPGGEDLEFRDVHAFDESTVYLLGSGPGDRSRIYKTSDGGKNWVLQFINDQPKGFFDCFGFWDAEHGLVYGDSVDGDLVVLETSDGEKWTRLPQGRLPKARPGEGGFAASGTCLITVGNEAAYIGTGAGSSRLLRTRDRGRSWEAFETVVASSTASAGITTLGFWDADHGIAAGGDIAEGDSRQDNIATTSDGGRSFRLASPPPFPGAIYGVASVPGSSPSLLVAVGPKGAAFSRDSASTWESISEEAHWAVGFASTGVGWMVGPEGRMTRLVIRRR